MSTKFKKIIGPILYALALPVALVLIFLIIMLVGDKPIFPFFVLAVHFLLYFFVFKYLTRWEHLTHPRFKDFVRYDLFHLIVCIGIAIFIKVLVNQGNNGIGLAWIAAPAISSGLAIVASLPASGILRWNA